MRGAHRHDKLRGRAVRIIPADAGSTLDEDRVLAMDEDHPR